MHSAKAGDLSVDYSGGGPLTREVSISYDPGTAVIVPTLTGNSIFLAQLWELTTSLMALMRKRPPL